MASFAPLLDQYLNESFESKKIKADEDKSVLDFEMAMKKRTWDFSLGYVIDDNKLESSSDTFNVSQVKSTSFSFGLERNFVWGGGLQFSNEFNKTDRSSVSSLFLGSSAPIQYEGAQNLTYSQFLGRNFLGRNNFKEDQISKRTLESQKNSLKNSKLTSLLTFFGAYSQVKLSKTVLSLQRDALLRADQRLKLVRKRVKDGLSERVDLLQAQALKLTYEENVLNEQKNLKKAEYELASILGVESFGKVKIYSKKAPKLPMPQGMIEKNLTLKSLEEKAEISRLTSEIERTSYLPIIQAYSTLKYNEYDASSSKARSKGTLFGDNKEVVLGINLTYPIGTPLGERKHQKSNIDYMIASARQKHMQNSLTVQEKKWKERFNLLNKNVQKSRRRLILSDKVLSEYKRMYKNGKASLDLFLNAEEDYIKNELTHVKNQFDRDILAVELSSLYGNLFEYLENNKTKF